MQASQATIRYNSCHICHVWLHGNSRNLAQVEKACGPWIVICRVGVAPVMRSRDAVREPRVVMTFV
jgi:hypothetical protein